MSTIRLTGNDTLIWTYQGVALPLFELPHGEVGKISFANDIAKVQTGKNENAIISYNASGKQATLDLRVLKGGSEDIKLNTALSDYMADPVSFILMSFSVVKKMGSGDGIVIADKYILTGGVFTKPTEMISNVEGDTEQAVTHYIMQFATHSRSFT